MVIINYKRIFIICLLLLLVSFLCFLRTAKAEELRIEGDSYFGCTDKDYIQKIDRHNIRRDINARNTALNSCVSTGNCIPLFDGEKVFIIDRSISSNLVRIRRYGAHTEYWTFDFAIEKPSKTKLESDSTTKILGEGKEFIFYTIKSGDSLSKLADLYYGDPKKYYLIEEYNRLKNSNHVIVGQKIKIPKIVRPFTLNQKESSTGRTVQQNLNRSDNNKKFYYLYSTILIVIGVIGLFFILKRGKKPYVAKKNMRNAHDDMAESMLKRSYQPEIEKNKQIYTHSFEYDETEGCEFYIVREHPSDKIVTKEKV